MPSPLILEFDLQPEFHRPKGIRIITEAIGGVVLLVLAGRGAISASAGGFVLLGIGVVVGGALLLAAWMNWRHRARWKRASQEAERALQTGDRHAEREGHEAVYRGVFLRHWRRWLAQEQIVRDLRDAGLAPARAILIGPARRWTSLPKSVSPDLVEPEFVRARPRGLAIGRVAFSGVIGALVMLWFGALAVRLILYSASSGQWSYGVIGGLCAATIIAWAISHFTGRGYSGLGGAGLIAGPSRLEAHGARHVRAWTPRDTILVVRRRRSRSSEISVDLISDGAAGSAGSVTFHFFGVNDPGFRTLWEMWIHPLEVDQLTES